MRLALESLRPSKTYDRIVGAASLGSSISLMRAKTAVYRVTVSGRCNSVVGFLKLRCSCYPRAPVHVRWADTSEMEARNTIMVGDCVWI
jgi:hypothetical protein